MIYLFPLLSDKKCLVPPKKDNKVGFKLCNWCLVIMGHFWSHFKKSFQLHRWRGIEKGSNGTIYKQPTPLWSS